MTHYNTNIQNRKLKKQILNFFSRIGFGAGRLPISGRLILIMTFLLFVSLFLPWLTITTASSGPTTYGPFSRYLGFIGYGIIISIIIVPFFLISHTKKEQIRAYIPFRLSDTQAVVFISTMILVSLFQIIFLSPAYKTFGAVELGSGFSLAGASVACMIICGYFLSKKIKNQNTESYFLDKNSYENLGEYKNIIHPEPHQENERKKENMSLPF